jgi:Ca2+-binding EF-hand superfamily protein
MEARQIAFVLLIAGSVWSTSAGTGYAGGQDSSSQVSTRGEMRFRGMDRDGDGVITRAEWRGSAQSFRQHDRNHDGVLSGDEIWVERVDKSDLQAQFDRADRNRDGALSPSEWWGDRDTFNRIDRNNDGVIGPAEFLGEDVTEPLPDRPSFAALDRNGNGVITSGEWNGGTDEFRALDTDRDGVLTQQEYRQGRTFTESAAYRAGRDRGLADGRQAGREDKTINGGKWDLEGQRELETADAGYDANMGSRADYQAGYRAGFRVGYREGFGPR